MASEMVERVAVASENERDRWGMRVNKMAGGEELFRRDDSGQPVVVQLFPFALFGTAAKALAIIEHAAAQAAIRAMRAPTDAMTRNGMRHSGTGEAVDVWQAMIDAALEE